MTRLLTRSTQINNLLGTIEQYQQDEVDDQAVIASFQETVTLIDSQLQGAFEERVAVSPPDSAMRRMAPEFQEALERLRAALESVRLALESTSSPDLNPALLDLAQTTEQVFAVIDRISAAEASEANLSPVVYMNDLMKVGFAVADGQMDAGVFRTMLTNALGHHYRSMAYIKAPAGASDTQKTELQAACQQHVEGLQEAERCFVEGEPAYIRSGLEQANEALKRLLRLQEAFGAQEASARVKQCVRCGAENEVQARHCKKCNAVIPTVLDTQSPTVDLHLEDEARSAGHVVSETTQPLLDMVAGIQGGTKVLSDLPPVLGALEQRTQVLRAQLAQVDPEKQATSPDDLEAMQWARERMTTGLQEMAEGISSLHRAIDAGNPAGLDVGVEAVLHGADKMAEVTRAAMRMAMQMQNNPGSPSA